MYDTHRTISLLRLQTFSAYDLQMLRMQCGLRLCANFRSKLKEEEGEESDPETPEDFAKMKDATAGELSEKATKLIDQLKAEHKTLTEGIARNRTLPDEKKFKGAALITDYTELVLVDQYLKIEGNEKQQFRQLQTTLEKLQIYNQFLRHIPGVGPAMAAVMISYFDPRKAARISNFWAYAGLDVGPDGRGRSRRAEHLIDREYTKKDGTKGIRKSVTYNPWLKSRLLGALATSMMRAKDSQHHYKKVYDWYRYRLETDPSRFKITSASYKKLYKSDKEAAIQTWPPLRIHRASLRYMVKQLLVQFWTHWRQIEGLPVTKTYHEEYHGHVHSGKYPWENWVRPEPETYEEGEFPEREGHGETM
jgi:Transposase IS116/IS110/IS902 family